MKIGLWAVWVIQIGAIALAQSTVGDQETPSNDAKEPHTLSNMLTPMPAVAPLSLRRVETAYHEETTYQVMQGTPGGAPESLPITSRRINKTIGKTRLRGWLAQPAETTPQGAVLLIHEWWGLNSTIKREADRLAGLGFKVFAVDLYGGQVAHGRREAASLAAQVQPPAALTTLKAAVGFLAKPADGKPLKVGVIGWSFGAAHALKLAMADPRPAALVIFYGELPGDPAQAAKISCPVLGFFAERDGWITPKKVQAFKNALTNPKATIQTFSYSTQPGFALDPQNIHDQAYADTARAKTAEFLERFLTP